MKTNENQSTPPVSKDAIIAQEALRDLQKFLADDEETHATVLQIILSAIQKSAASQAAVIDQMREALKDIRHVCMSDKAVDSDRTVAEVHKIATNSLALSSPDPQTKEE